MQTKNTKLIINNLKMKNFTLISQNISGLPLLKLFVLDIKNIYIRTIFRQYIKKSLHLKFIFLTKMTVNVNNALNVFKMFKLFLNEMYYFLYSGKHLLPFSKINYMLYNLFTLNKVIKHQKNKVFKNKNLYKIKDKTFVSYTKSTTYLENKTILYQVKKRTMLSRTVASKNNLLSITNTEATHIAQATKQFYDMLKKPLIIDELAKSISNKNVDLIETSKQLLEYVSDNSYSNGTTKLNLAAAFWAKQKFSLNSLQGSTNSKIILPNTKIQLKSFVEIREANTILERNPYVSDIIVTGDTVKVSSNSMPYPDYIVKYNHNLFGKSERYLDCKTGPIETNGGFFRGTVHQVYTTNNETIWYPHKKNCFPEYLQNFYKGLIDKLNNESFMNDLRTKMSAKEYQIFYMESVKLKAFVMPQIFNINDIDVLHKSLYLIQSLPTFPKAFTIIHVHALKSVNLQDYQDPFIQSLIEKVQPSIFSNERTVQKFMGYAIILYKKKVDSKIVDKLKPLKSNYEWLATELDNIDLDFYVT